MLGLINQPILKECWVGAAGRQTTLNGRPVRTRSCGSLSEAHLCITSPDILTTKAERAAFARLAPQVGNIRYGGDCYSYGLLAAGHVDIVFESDLKPYDFMALVPVVEGAGGVMTDWQGNPLTLDSGPQVLAAATPDLHKEALALIQETA